MRTIISIALAVVLAGNASAAPLAMICKNPRQEYLAVFDAGTRSLVLNPDTDKTHYAVLAVEPGGTVSGMVGKSSGLGYVAYFDDRHRIDFYSDDKVVQTDACRSDNTPMDIGVGN